jgi:hypothetical protein
MVRKRVKNKKTIPKDRIELKKGHLPIYGLRDVKQMVKKGQEAIDQYDLISSGKRKKFEKGTLSSRSNAIALTRHLVEDAYGAKSNEEKRNLILSLRAKDFSGSNLSSLIAGPRKGKEGAFSSHISLFINAFPELKLKPWHFDRVPRNLWSHPNADEIAKKAVRWYVTEYLGIDPRTREGRKRLTCEVNSQSPGPNPIPAIRASMPYDSHIDMLQKFFAEHRLHPLEFTKGPVGYFKGPEGEKRRRRAMRLIAKRLGLDPKDPKSMASLSADDLRKLRMSGVMRDRKFVDLLLSSNPDITKEDLINDPEKGRYRTSLRTKKKP